MMYGFRDVGLCRSSAKMRNDIARVPETRGKMASQISTIVIPHPEIRYLEKILVNTAVQKLFQWTIDQYESLQNLSKLFYFKLGLNEN